MKRIRSYISRRLPPALLGAVLLLGVWPAQPVQAGVLAGFATEWTQILNNVQLVASYIRYGEQLRQQILQVLDMAKNTQALTNLRWGSIAADLANLNRIVQTGRGLAYSMANIDAQFTQRFPGYGYRPNQFYNDYQDWSATTLDTIRGTLDAANLQSSQMASEEGLLQALRNMSQTDEGRMEALQTGLELTEQITQQMQKLREIMLADIQSKAAYQAWQMQEGADRAAAEQQLLTPGAPRVSPFTYLGGNR